MKMLLLLIALGSGLCAAAQNYAVRWLSMDGTHEFNAVAGCPTNWPVAVDNIGTNSASPWANRVILDRAALDQVYTQIGASFTNWHQNTWKPFVAQRDQTSSLTRSNNFVQLRSLYDDMATYEQRWQAGLSATTSVQINTVLRTHNAFLLQLKPVLQDLYRGD